MSKGNHLESVKESENSSSSKQYHALYVYGIVEESITRLKSEGVGNRKDNVYAIPFKDVYAIVSETPFEEYDPTEANTLAHEKVIQEVLKQDVTLAPMRFCTVLKSRQDVLKLLHSAYLPFKKNILKIRNKREFSIKVFLQMEKAFATKSGDDVVAESVKMATELHEVVEPIADDIVLEDQITDDMIFNASVLLHQDHVENFYSEITKFDERFTDILKIRISGPTAPYNFVNMPTS